MKTWAACLPGDQAKAMLNEMAEKILDLLDAEISFTRNAEETGRLLQLADFGLCAATDKTLRWRLYLRYGAVLPPDRVRRTFVWVQFDFTCKAGMSELRDEAADMEHRWYSSGLAA